MAEALLYDATRRLWLRFERPIQVAAASEADKAASLLAHAVERSVREDLWVVCLAAYECAPAFDPTLPVRADASGFPPLWSGLFRAPEILAELPRTIRPPSGESPPGCPTPHSPSPPWLPAITEDEYETGFSRIKELIAAGETYQVNYSFRLRSPYQGDPYELFAVMIEAQGPGYGAYIDTGDWTVCSASPELFFSLEEGILLSRPMKGTAARGLWHEQDLELAERLRRSPKDRAENVMIVDMVRNDLGRIAETGTVTVTKLAELEKYPTVWQLTSTVECRTSAGIAEVFSALFPPASITGAPKARTMEIIAELESTPRRIYTGTVGFVAPGGRAQFNVAIRTVLVDRRSGEAEYGIGGGIVWDSKPDSEFAECHTKARVLTHRRPRFDLFESILWTAGVTGRVAAGEVGAAASGVRDVPGTAPETTSDTHPATRPGTSRTSEVVQASTPCAGAPGTAAAPVLEEVALCEAGYFLLARHLGRLEHSARYFSRPFDAGAIQRLLAEMAAALARARPAVPHKVRVFLAADGSLRLDHEPLPPPPCPDITKPQVCPAAEPVDSTDPFLYHKTTYREAYERALLARPGYDDVLLFNERGELTESTRANLVVELDGALFTPPICSGLLPGTLRAHLLDRGTVSEQVLAVADLERCTRLFLANSVRGMWEVTLAPVSGKSAPGAVAPGKAASAREAGPM